jgi:hypothetical protein
MPAQAAPNSAAQQPTNVGEHQVEQLEDGDGDRAPADYGLPTLCERCAAPVGSTPAEHHPIRPRPTCAPAHTPAEHHPICPRPTCARARGQLHGGIWQTRCHQCSTGATAGWKTTKKPRRSRSGRAAPLPSPARPPSWAAQARRRPQPRRRCAQWRCIGCLRAGFSYSCKRSVNHTGMAFVDGC